MDDSFWGESTICAGLDYIIICCEAIVPHTDSVHHPFIGRHDMKWMIKCIHQTPFQSIVHTVPVPVRVLNFVCFSTRRASMHHFQFDGIIFNGIVFIIHEHTHQWIRLLCHWGSHRDSRWNDRSWAIYSTTIGPLSIGSVAESMSIEQLSTDTHTYIVWLGYRMTHCIASSHRISHPNWKILRYLSSNKIIIIIYYYDKF